MGAVFNTMTVDGTKTKEEVKRIFSDAQDQDRYENGHSYSGGFGMARGLMFYETTFGNDDDAYEMLERTCVKWQAARAVRFINKNGVETWMIGALCSS